MADSLLKLADVSLFYGRRKILGSVSLDVDGGESVAIMGKTGSGKSSLLASVCGLIKPVKGDIRVIDRSILHMRSSQLARFRRDQMGVVFQSGELLPALTAIENVALPAMLSGVPWAQAQTRARQLLESLEVLVTDVPAMHLSGGEQTRVGIARAMINEPNVLLADEPTGALDAQTRDSVCDLIYEMPRRLRCALLVVTHDPAVASGADRVYRLADTRLVDSSARVGTE